MSDEKLESKVVKCGASIEAPQKEQEMFGRMSQVAASPVTKVVRLEVRNEWNAERQTFVETVPARQSEIKTIDEIWARHGLRNGVHVVVEYEEVQ